MHAANAPQTMSMQARTYALAQDALAQDAIAQPGKDRVLRSAKRLKIVAAAAANAAEACAKATPMSLFAMGRYMSDTAVTLQGIVDSQDDKIAKAKADLSDMQDNLYDDIHEKVKKDRKLLWQQQAASVAELREKMAEQAALYAHLAIEYKALDEKYGALLHMLAEQAGTNAVVAPVEAPLPIVFVSECPDTPIHDDGVELEQEIVEQAIEQAIETSDDEYYGDGSANFDHGEYEYVADPAMPGGAVLKLTASQPDAARLCAVPYRCANKM